MSEFFRVGTFSSALDACGAVGVVFENTAHAQQFARLKTADDRHGKHSASISYFSDSRGGVVFNFKENSCAVWFDDHDESKRLTRAQRKRLKEQFLAASKAAKQEREQEYKRAAALAFEVWRSASKCTQHSYLTAKQVEQTETLRTIPLERAKSIIGGHLHGSKGYLSDDGSGLLVVPLKGDIANVQAVQLIDCFGSKYFLRGAKKSGAFWCCDRLPKDRFKPLVIAIGEGVATALSYGQHNSVFVVSAMDCGNLLPVAKKFRVRYPLATIRILSDVGRGEMQARAAVNACNGEYCKPPISIEINERFNAAFGGNPTDWNDYYRITAPK